LKKNASRKSLSVTVCVFEKKYSYRKPFPYQFRKRIFVNTSNVVAPPPSPPNYLHLQHSIIHPYKAIQSQHLSNQQITYLYSHNLQFMQLSEAPVSLPPLQLSRRTFRCNHTSRTTLQDLSLQPHLCTTPQNLELPPQRRSTSNLPPRSSSAASTNLAPFVFFSFVWLIGVHEAIVGCRKQFQILFTFNIRRHDLPAPSWLHSAFYIF